MRSLLSKIVGDTDEKIVKRLKPIVADINALEPAMLELTDEELRGLDVEFRERLTTGEALDDLLPESFAATREAARRALGQRHYDVELILSLIHI